eukprot:TRINITY_DN1736_c0_g1_i1.p1 TRINITY_DN1736_c0_g1~~TRINITY_DN1736_c0_g1_i1.p1  ORF type:complete len:774 (+),score=114.21 TRINITY_DN1736_c0_g1_i1:77-2398(+)
MDWNTLTTYFIHELGDPGSPLPITLENDNKSKAALDAKIQAAYNTATPVVAIYRSSDNTRVDSDLGVVFLAENALLEVEFANKFYWVIRDHQRKQWIQEFRSHASNASFLTGDQTKQIFMNSGLSNVELAQIWNLADVDQDNALSVLEFLTAKFLIEARLQGQVIEPTLPESLQASVGRNRSTSTRKFVPRELPSTSHQVPMSRPQALSESGSEWKVSSAVRAAYYKLWDKHSRGGFVTGGVALQLFSESGVERVLLAEVWTLADGDVDHQLSMGEFCVALHLIRLLMKGYALPKKIPASFAQLFSDGNIPGSASPVKRIKRPSRRHVRQSSHPMVLQTPQGELDARSASPTFGSIAPLPAVPPRTPSSGSRSARGPTPLYPLIEKPPKTTPFTPFTPFKAHAQPYSIGQFNLPKQPAGTDAPLPPTDFIKDIAANIRQQAFPARTTPPLPVQASPDELVAGAERSLMGVPKFDSDQIDRNTLIGGGTFAKVWLGQVAGIGVKVAIKDMTFKSEKEIDMWKREVQLLSHLQHYNYLVKIKGYAVSTEHLTIVMELMEGGSLYDVIHNATTPVTWSMLQKARILRHIAKGIDSIHKEGIVHRDLKSMNVLLDGKSIAKIADLGCSRFFREETMTIGIGSPLWMSPEVQKGGVYNFSADVFSYGVICYEVFNEKLPDYDISRRTVVIPQDCIGYTIIRECTNKDFNQRPTASQLIESMDLLITSFCAAVGRVVRANYQGDVGELPAENDLSGWYNVLLSYGRETFDVLLSTGMTL